MIQENRLDRAEGIFLASAAGDALGWPQELRGGHLGGKQARRSRRPAPRYDSWIRRGGSRFGGYYSDRVEAGEYSDDTQLICALARSYLTGSEWLEWFVEVELPTWLLYQRGGGRAVLAAARSWSEHRPPWHATDTKRSSDQTRRYREAGGNGAAMRIAPHVLATETREELLRNVLFDAATTHGHPRAHIGALIYAAALREAFNARETVEYGQLIRAAREGILSPSLATNLLGNFMLEERSRESFEQEWESAAHETMMMLDFVEDAIHRSSMADDDFILEKLGIAGPEGGSGTKTAVAAIYLASRGAARPLSGLLSAAFLEESDTDTIGAMVGGLLGAIHGTDWLKELQLVQDSDYLRKLARGLLKRESQFALWADRSSTRDSRRLREDILSIQAGQATSFPDGRLFIVDGRITLDPGDVVRTRLLFEDGQSMYIDQKLPRETRREVAPSKKSAVLPQSEVRVRLLVQDLGTTVRYYTILLGREVPVQEGEALISPHLSFREGAQPITAEGQEVDLAIELSGRAIEQLNLEPDAESGPEWFRGVDPDGRKLRIHWRK